MEILLLESSAAAKAVLRGRIVEALRQAEIRGIELVEGSETSLTSQSWGTICGCILGPSLHQTAEATLQNIRRTFSQGPLALVLNEDAYNEEAASLTRKLDVRVYSMGELTALVAFLVECEKQQSLIASRKSKNIFGVCQFKGGVGTTTLAAALGGCWARHGISTALIDLDDVNPHLTAWARVGISKRSAVSEHLSLGHVPESRIVDVAAPIEGYQNKLAVIGQPEQYNDGFHFKANVIDAAPSSSEFMHSLLSALKAHYEGVVIDLSRSWGLATFATLPRCERVLLVTDEDRQSIKRSLDILRRLRKESDDPDEFDLSRWILVINGYSGDRIKLEEVRTLIEESDLTGAKVPLVTIPYSFSGGGWAGEHGTTFIDIADPGTREAIAQLAYSLIPYQSETTPESQGGRAGFFSTLISQLRGR